MKERCGKAAKCCRQVLGRSVVERCCEEMLWRSVVVKCCREML